MDLRILCETPQALIGLGPNDRLIQSTFEFKTLDQDEYICWYSRHLKFGVETDFRGESEARAELDTIFYYVSEDAARDASDDEIFLAFSARLPFGLEREMTESDVTSLLGHPECVREEIYNEIAGFIQRALQYEASTGVKFKVEFKRGFVYRLVLHKSRQ